MTEQDAWNAYCAKRDAPPETRDDLIAKLRKLVADLRERDSYEQSDFYGTDLAGVYADELEALLPERSNP